MQDTSNRINPLATAAAASVVVASLTATAFFAGWIPGAMGQSSATGTPPATAATARIGSATHTAAAAAKSVKPATSTGATRVAAGANLGRIESIAPVTIKGQASGVGAVAGGVGGALLGNTMGQGNGRTVMTVLGAAGGALAGNEVEKNIKRETRYDVVVRMDDGSQRTVRLGTPTEFRSGDRVRVEDGRLLPA